MPDPPLTGLGRYAGPATLILSSLAEGARHGYALTKDIESFAGMRLAPGTLYEALTRLQAQGLIEAVASEDRRRPYQLTAAGATALREHLAAQRRVARLLRWYPRSWRHRYGEEFTGGAVTLVQRTELSPQVLRYEAMLGSATCAVMVAFLTGCLAWIVDGGPGRPG